MSEPYPSRLLDRFMLRLPDGLRDQVAKLAKNNKRSMNAEIIAALELWTGRDQTAVAPEAAKALRNALAHFAHTMADKISSGEPIEEVHDYIEKSIKYEERVMPHETDAGE